MRCRGCGVDLSLVSGGLRVVVSPTGLVKVVCSVCGYQMPIKVDPKGYLVLASEVTHEAAKFPEVPEFNTDLPIERNLMKVNIYLHAVDAWLRDRVKNDAGEV
jgi:hypothetical protein